MGRPVGKFLHVCEDEVHLVTKSSLQVLELESLAFAKESHLELHRQGNRKEANAQGYRLGVAGFRFQEDFGQL